LIRKYIVGNPDAGETTETVKAHGTVDARLKAARST
jgi:hypothetical protein